jgi:hypothetical protein
MNPRRSLSGTMSVVAVTGPPIVIHAKAGIPLFFDPTRKGSWPPLSRG